MTVFDHSAHFHAPLRIRRNSFVDNEKRGGRSHRVSSSKPTGIAR
jgi:hypothetical protein